MPKRANETTTGGGAIKRAKMSSKQASTTSMVRKALNKIAEKKAVSNYTVTALYGGTGTTSYTQQLTNAVVEGTDVTNRVGRKISLQSLEYKITINGFGTEIPDAGFWAIVYDREGAASTPALTDVFDFSNSPPSGELLRSPFINQERFKILKRQEWQLGGNGSNGCPPYAYHGYIDLTKLGRDQTMTYNSTTSTSYISGTIYIFVSASGLFGQTVSNYSQCHINSQCRFIDV